MVAVSLKKKKDNTRIPLHPLYQHSYLFRYTYTLLLLSVSDQGEKERETRLQELRQHREERAQKGRTPGAAGEVVMKKVEKSADGSTLSQLTKTDRFAQSGRPRTLVT